MGTWGTKIYQNDVSDDVKGENSYLYTGQQYDANTGFYYLRARYLDPANARFLTRDLYNGNVFEPQTLHKYAYVCNDPVNNYDPRGLWMEKVIKGILAHKWINARYIMEHPTHLVNRDRYLGRITYGRMWRFVDIIDYTSNEIYEIKPWKGTVDGLAQVERYLKIIQSFDTNWGNFLDIESVRLGDSWPVPAKSDAWPLGGVINYFLETPGLICYSLYDPDPDPIGYRSWELLKAPEFRLEMTPVVAVALLTLALPGLIRLVKNVNTTRLRTMSFVFVF